MTPSAFHIQWDPVNKKGSLEINQLETDLPEFFKFLNQRNLQLKNLEFRKRTLDDLFTQLTGRHLHE